MILSSLVDEISTQVCSPVQTGVHLSKINFYMLFYARDCGGWLKLITLLNTGDFYQMALYVYWHHASTGEWSSQLLLYWPVTSEQSWDHHNETHGLRSSLQPLDVPQVTFIERERWCRDDDVYLYVCGCCVTAGDVCGCCIPYSSIHGKHTAYWQTGRQRQQRRVSTMLLQCTHAVCVTHFSLV